MVKINQKRIGSTRTFIYLINWVFIFQLCACLGWLVHIVFSGTNYIDFSLFSLEINVLSVTVSILWLSIPEVLCNWNRI